VKLYITGSVASGKSTLARRLSAATGVPCFHLDEVVHTPDPARELGNRKRTPEERDALFNEILAMPDYIIEDTGRECFARGLREVDEVVLLDIPLAIRRVRILRRFVKQKLGLERAAYRPCRKILRYLWRWANEFDASMAARAAENSKRFIVLRTKREIDRYVDKIVTENN
jgi:Adenylate kinase and related kinases